MILIKRYSNNRKLYDTTQKKYVTLQEIERMIKEGEEVHIVDSESGEDITSNILSQIIANKAKKGKMYPSSFLIDIIKKGKITVYDSVKKAAHLLGETATNVEENMKIKLKKIIDKEVEKEKKKYISKIDSRIENIIIRFLKKLNVPTQKDIKELKDKLDKIGKKIERLENKIKKRKKR